MKVSDNGLALILEYEGFVPYLYNDPANATVGIGILVHIGRYHEQRGICARCDEWPRQREPQLWLTEEVGRALLSEKVYGVGRFAGGQNYADAVERTTRELNQNEFDALVDFCYNLGSGGYINSSVRAAVNGGGNVCIELMRYVFGVGVVGALPGLVRRREAECVLFNTPYIPPEEEMKFPFLCWVPGYVDGVQFAGGVHLVGPKGVRYINDGGLVDELGRTLEYDFDANGHVILTKALSWRQVLVLGVAQ